ncbi:MAG TPA: NADH:flavin oxidoreductase [Firmicutes bacterium]|nr:NADH:flavin oxidoreductase [Bacillota bacterium]HHY97186.1 NADH:flavin oxidoreductase [Bacillota bacterium]
MIGIPHLDSPITISGIEIRNRIVMPPMVRFGWAGTSGMATDRHIEHYARRARGGAGLIIVEATAVSPAGRLSTSQLGIWDDAHIPGLQKIVRACHRAGARIVLQIHHAGANTNPENVGGTLVAPSAIPVPGRRSSAVPHPLTQSEIRAIVREFGLAAERAERAGFDGVEIHGAHGFLLSQFLSPLTNQRTDEYGGSLENRLRFPLEVVREVMARLSPGLLIGYRLGASDLIDGGLTIEEGKIAAGKLQAEGVHLIHVSRGFSDGSPAQAPGTGEFSHLVDLAASIKEVVRVPVVAVGGIRLPNTARDILARGFADMVAIGRAMLADPDWAGKAISGHDSDIVRCRQCEGGCRHDAGKCPVTKD